MKWLSDEKYEALVKAANRAEELESHLGVVTQERDAQQARADKAETDKQAEITRLNEEHAKAIKAKGEEASKQASAQGAEIARQAGLNEPVPMEAKANQTASSEVESLREKLATETDPTKRANIAREIRKLTDAAKSKK